MRVGVFGGTFDPVHVGHLILAEQAREQARLDQVWFIPAARPPHKQSRPVTPFHQRAEMLALAIAGNPAFRIDDLEKDRPGLSYTVDTLAELHLRHPEFEWFLMLGSDCLPDLPHWRDPARIAELAGYLIWHRAGWPVWSSEQLREALDLPREKSLRVEEVHGLLVDISSHELRKRTAEGRTIRYLTPRAVESYVATHRLYQESDSA